MSAAKNTHIVIVGGGAGGLELAVKLSRRYGKKSKINITLVDETTTHVWKPLLHEVAAGTIHLLQDEVNYFAYAVEQGFNFSLGSLRHINRQDKTIELAPLFDSEFQEDIPKRILSYDILVIAVGSIANDFGVPGVKKFCHFLDNRLQAEYFHQEFLRRLMRAAYINAISPEKTAVEIIIVGGGATGVELAAELHHAIDQAARFGLNIAAGKISFTLIESASRLLSTLAQQVSQRIVEKLTQMNIQVLLNERVIEVSQQGVTTHSHKFIAGNMIIWTAGIKAPDSLIEMSDLERNKINQLLVVPTLQTTLDPAIFALGDCACCPQADGKPVPPRAQAAHQQAAFLVRALAAYLRNKPLPYYRYHDYGSIITLSHYKTVGTVMSRTSKSLLLEGKIARLAYLALYKSHQIKLFGWWRTFLFSIQRLFSKHYPRLKLH